MGTEHCQVGVKPMWVGYTPAGLQKASQGPYLLSTVSQCLMLDGDHVS